jgi:hypothetical protein
MSANGKKPMLKPAIVIGNGGTGNQVVRRLKKLVADQYGDTPTLLSFLVVDTDEDAFNDQSWAPLPALTDLEQAPLYDPQVPFSDVHDNPGAYPEIHDWLAPAVDVGLLDRQDGAGQMRMLGRVAFYKSFAFFARRIDHFFDQCQRIQTLLEAMDRYDFNVESDPVVYLVSSVCGGQGAGSFIDAAVALRVLAGSRFPRLNLIGVLTLPSVYSGIVPRENWSKICANTHAAIKEMDYLMHSTDRSKMRFRFPAPISRTITPQAALFDLCYLIDNRHHRGALSGENEVYDQIAAQLFLEIGTPFGARSDSIRVNLNTVAGIERDRVYNTGRRYSGFANHTISFDREKIVEMASLESAREMLSDKLLGLALAADEIDETVLEFVRRRSLGEPDPDDLLNALISRREISQELITVSYSQQRPDHGMFARDVWARFDAFWLRRVTELRLQMEKRTRAKLDGVEEQGGVLSELDQLLNDLVRRRGVAAAHSLAGAMLARLRALEVLTHADSQHRDLAQRFFEEVEAARTSLANIGQQLEQLRSAAERAGLLSRVWRMFGYLATFGLWRPGAADEESRARQFHDLSLRAQDQRNRLLNGYNRAVEHRLAGEVRDVAACLYSEIAAQLSGCLGRLETIKSVLEESGRFLLEESNRLTADARRRPFVGGNTMRRDVSADYVDQYRNMRGRAAAEEVFKLLLPEGRSAIDSIENGHDRERIRREFQRLYAEDILDRKDRDSLAEMIDRFNAGNGGASLSDRISEGLRFCLPFWDIRVPGNQFTTEVLLVGLEQSHSSVENYLNSHAD